MPASATSGAGLRRAGKTNGRFRGSATSVEVMKLSRSDKKALFIAAKTSSAVEGIHHPFKKGDGVYWPESMDDLVRYWTKRVAAQSLAQKVSRAGRSRGSS